MRFELRAAWRKIQKFLIVWFPSNPRLVPECPSRTPSVNRSRCSPKNFPDRADLIDKVHWVNFRNSITHMDFMYGLQIEAATLPEGWANRTVKVETPATDGKIGWCIEGHDLFAASKLVTFREKDREFVRVLMRENYVKFQYA